MFGINPPSKELVQGTMGHAVTVLVPAYVPDPDDDGLGPFVTSGVAHAMAGVIRATMGGKGSIIPKSVTDAMADDMGEKLAESNPIEGDAEFLLERAKPLAAEFDASWPPGDPVRAAVDTAIHDYIADACSVEP